MQEGNTAGVERPDLRTAERRFHDGEGNKPRLSSLERGCRGAGWGHREEKSLGEEGLDWATGAKTTVLAWALGSRQGPKNSPWDEGLREGCLAWPLKEGRQV